MAAFQPLVSERAPQVRECLLRLSSPGEAEDGVMEEVHVDTRGPPSIEAVANIDRHCRRSFPAMRQHVSVALMERLRDCLVSLASLAPDGRGRTRAAVRIQRQFRRRKREDLLFVDAGGDAVPAYAMLHNGQRLNLSTKSRGFMLGCSPGGQLYLDKVLNESSLWTTEAASPEFGCCFSLVSANGTHLTPSASLVGRPLWVFEYFDGCYALRQITRSRATSSVYLCHDGDQVVMRTATPLASSEVGEAIGALWTIQTDVPPFPWTNLRTGTRVALRSCHGTFLSMDANGAVRANTKDLSPLETFAAIGSLDFFRFSAIGAGGRFLTVNDSGGVDGRRSSTAEAMVFRLELIGSSHVAIRTAPGRYLSVDPAGTVSGVINVPFLTDQESFVLVIVDVAAGPPESVDTDVGVKQVLESARATFGELSTAANQSLSKARDAMSRVKLPSFGRGLRRRSGSGGSGEHPPPDQPPPPDKPDTDTPAEPQ